jgi:nucleoside-diphosphate-sugar epimerase
VEVSRAVLDAAGQAGVHRVVGISSASAVGFAWSERGASPESVPVTEEHPFVGDDSYGLSKQVGEVVAGAASRRGDARGEPAFPFVGIGERLRGHLDAVHADPGRDRRGLWAWLDTRDAARSVLAALRAHHVITVTAPDTTALEPSRELLRRYHPTTEVDPDLGGFETLFGNRKARDLLGFTTIHGWRDVTTAGPG